MSYNEQKLKEINAKWDADDVLGKQLFLFVKGQDRRVCYEFGENESPWSGEWLPDGVVLTQEWLAVFTGWEWEQAGMANEDKRPIHLKLL